MSTTAILMDVCTVGIILIMFFVAKRKGFVRSVLELLGTAIAAVLAYFTSGAAGEIIFNLTTRGRVIEALTSALENGVVAANGIVDTITSAVSLLVGNSELATQVQSFLESAAGQNNTQVATQLADTVVAPAMMPVLRTLAFVILFVVFMVAIRLISKILSKGIRAIPILGSLDSFLGGIVGILQGAIIVLIVTLILASLSSAGGDPFLLPSEVAQTYIFHFFYNIAGF